MDTYALNAAEDQRALLVRLEKADTTIAELMQRDSAREAESRAAGARQAAELAAVRSQLEHATLAQARAPNQLTVSCPGFEVR